MQSTETENRKSRSFDSKPSISTHYLHFYSISCIHNQRSNFIAYTSFCFIRYKTDELIEKLEKLRNFLLKTKDLNQIVLRKGIFTSNKAPFVWQKGTWIIQ